jgi:zinc protease
VQSRSRGDVAYAIDEYRLDNGLRVFASEDPGLGVVAVNLWYDVGSRHEDKTRRGYAHLFEHLMFQGSRHVRAGQHMELLHSHGASLNATTSFDRTNYFESFPTGALDLALWLEADRLA